MSRALNVASIFRENRDILCARHLSKRPFATFNARDFNHFFVRSRLLMRATFEISNSSNAPFWGIYGIYLLRVDVVDVIKLHKNGWNVGF